MPSLGWLIAYAAVAVILGVTVPVYGGPYAVRFIFHELPFMGTTFTSAKWASAGSCSGLTDLQCEKKWQRCERGGMVRTLLRDHLTIGKTRKLEATTLLGEATTEPGADVGSFVRNGHTCIRYPVGYCSGLGVDMDYVELCFDATDLLSSKQRFQS